MSRLVQLAAAIAKELRLIARDPQALGILFVMPPAFVLVMSLALRDAFQAEGGVRFPVLLVDHDGGRVGTALESRLSQQPGLELAVERPPRDGIDRAGPAGDSGEPSDPGPIDARARADVRAGRYRFAVIVRPGASADAEARAARVLPRAAGGGEPVDPGPGAVAVELLADPAVRAEHRALLVAGLNLGLAGLASEILAERLALVLSGAEERPSAVPQLFAPVRDPFLQPRGEAVPRPSAVQQNAPGWGVMAMFFLVVPLAGTLVRERREGSLLRLRTMAAPLWLVLVGKAVPYFLVNQVQLALILLEGRTLVPWLGGDRLELGSEPGALVLLSVAVSVAAIGYGLAVATLCRTAEQATVVGAASVLLLGAIGGVMVPRMVMPAGMQALSWISPMAWGLEGFLAVLVRGERTADVLDECGALLAFGTACLALGAWLFHRHPRA